MEQRKLPHANPANQRPLLVGNGLIIALSLILMAFEWRTFHSTATTMAFPFSEETIRVDILSYTPPAPPAPPAPPRQTVSSQIDLILDVTPDPTDITDNPDPLDVVFPGLDGPAPHFVDVPESTTDVVVTYAAEMPRFSGCFTEGGSTEAEVCFQRQMQRFLSQNLRYPKEAKLSNRQGKVFVSFIVEKDGSVSNVTVLRGIGAGCDEEAVRVVSMLPTFLPGKQMGRPVRVQYTLPINFKLK